MLEREADLNARVSWVVGFNIETVTLVSDNRQTDSRVTPTCLQSLQHLSGAMNFNIRRHFKAQVSAQHALSAGKNRPAGCRVVTHAGCHGAVKRYDYYRSGRHVSGEENTARRRPYSVHTRQLLLAGDVNVPAAEM